MNRLTSLTVIAFLVLGGMVWALGMQKRQLTNLRSEHEHLASKLSGLSENPATPGPNEVAPTSTVSAPQASSELLRLRNEVSQLTGRRNELAAARAENERLLVQVAARRTNTMTLPPGYIRKGEAQMVGYNSPEATLQSWLWAIRNGDLTNFARAMVPEVAQKILPRIEEHTPARERMLKDTEALIGLGVVSREQLPDGTVNLRVIVTPEIPPMDIRFTQISNEWKMGGIP